MYHYWNDTICIHCDNPNTIAQQLTHLLEPEGFCRLNELPPYPDPDPEQIPYIWKLGCPLIITLFPGQGGWTIIKTFPFEFLCQRTEGASRPRLSALAMELGCDAFHLGVYDRVAGILLEADAAGRTFVSGCFEDCIPSDRFYDEQIDDMELISGFSLLKVPETLQAAMRASEESEVSKKQAEIERLQAEVERLKTENADYQEAEKLLLDVGGDYFGGLTAHTTWIDRAMVKAMEIFRCWYSNSLIEDIYTNPQKLAAKEAKLLYFQPPTSYQPRQRYVLTEDRFNEIYGIEESDGDVSTHDPPYLYVESNIFSIQL